MTVHRSSKLLLQRFQQILKSTQRFSFQGQARRVVCIRNTQYSANVNCKYYSLVNGANTKLHVTQIRTGKHFSIFFVHGKNGSRSLWRPCPSHVDLRLGSSSSRSSRSVFLRRHNKTIVIFFVGCCRRQCRCTPT